MKTILALLVLLVAVWAVLSGHYSTEPLVFALAVVSLVFVLFVSRRIDRVLGAAGPAFLVFGWLWRIPRYTLFMIRQVIAANLHVTRLLFDPRVQLAPRILHVRASQRTELARSFLANSITFTPGTVTLDLDGDRLLVHALDAVSASAVINGEMDRAASWLEGSGSLRVPSHPRDGES